MAIRTRDITCPLCEAGPGAGCVADGRPTKTHRSRLLNARQYRRAYGPFGTDGLAWPLNRTRGIGKDVQALRGWTSAQIEERSKYLENLIRTLPLSKLAKRKPVLMRELNALAFERHRRR